MAMSYVQLEQPSAPELTPEEYQKLFQPAPSAPPLFLMKAAATVKPGDLNDQLYYGSLGEQQLFYPRPVYNNIENNKLLPKSKEEAPQKILNDWLFIQERELEALGFAQITRSPKKFNTYEKTYNRLFKRLEKLHHKIESTYLPAAVLRDEDKQRILKELKKAYKKARKKLPKDDRDALNAVYATQDKYLSAYLDKLQKSKGKENLADDGALAGLGIAALCGGWIATSDPWCNFYMGRVEDPFGLYYMNHELSNIFTLSSSAFFHAFDGCVQALPEITQCLSDVLQSTLPAVEVATQSVSAVAQVVGGFAGEGAHAISGLGAEVGATVSSLFSSLSFGDVFGSIRGGFSSLPGMSGIGDLFSGAGGGLGDLGEGGAPLLIIGVAICAVVVCAVVLVVAVAVATVAAVYSLVETAALTTKIMFKHKIKSTLFRLANMKAGSATVAALGAVVGCACGALGTWGVSTAVGAIIGSTVPLYGTAIGACVGAGVGAIIGIPIGAGIGGLAGKLMVEATNVVKKGINALFKDDEKTKSSLNKRQEKRLTKKGLNIASVEAAIQRIEEVQKESKKSGGPQKRMRYYKNKIKREKLLREIKKGKIQAIKGKDSQLVDDETFDFTANISRNPMTLFQRYNDREYISFIPREKTTVLQRPPF